MNFGHAFCMQIYFLFVKQFLPVDHFVGNKHIPVYFMSYFVLRFIFSVQLTISFLCLSTGDERAGGGGKRRVVAAVL